MIRLSGASGQAQIPEHLWPAGLLITEPIYFGSMTKKEANAFLTAWDHPLGEYNRPFGYQAWGLAVDGVAVAVAVSGSTVSSGVNVETGRQLPRMELVELARIARHPDHPGVLRAMLRLWRDYLAPKWDYWPVSAAVSYALPGKAGNLYRFDGWRKVGQVKPSGGGGTWSSRPVAAGIADGRKTLFVYEYD